MPSSWQSVYDRAACPACKATTGEPCRRTTGQVGALTSVPHRARRRVAGGLPTFSGDAARAAGWVPLSDVLAALRDAKAWDQWIGLHWESGWPADVRPEQARIAADYLAERFGGDGG